MMNPLNLHNDFQPLSICKSDYNHFKHFWSANTYKCINGITELKILAINQVGLGNHAFVRGTSLKYLLSQFLFSSSSRSFTYYTCTTCHVVRVLFFEMVSKIKLLLLSCSFFTESICMWFCWHWTSSFWLDFFTLFFSTVFMRVRAKRMALVLSFSLHWIYVRNSAYNFWRHFQQQNIPICFCLHHSMDERRTRMMIGSKDEMSRLILKWE